MSRRIPYNQAINLIGKSVYFNDYNNQALYIAKLLEVKKYEKE